MRLSFSKSLVFAFLLSMAILACNRPPDLPVTPEVSFADVVFEVKNAGDPLFEENTLKLFILRCFCSFRFKSRFSTLSSTSISVIIPYFYKVVRCSSFGYNNNI